MLEFWALWCAPCRAAIPRISALAEKYSGKVTEPAFDAIIDGINTYSDQLQLPREIYHLVAQAFQKRIDWMPYPENVDMQKHYSKMADWYARANKKSKAIDAQLKAIQALKNKKDFTAEDLDALQSRLQQLKRL